MKHYQILPKTLLQGDLATLESTALKFHPYLVSIAFRKNEYCLLSTLQFRFDSKSDWKVAASNIGSHEGEITLELGSFDPNNTIQLFWILNAPLTKINAIAIYLVNRDTKKMINVKPAAVVKSIEKGKSWSDENQNIPLTF